MAFTTRSFILKVGHMGNISMITGKEVKSINAILLFPLRDSWIVNFLFCVSVSTQLEICVNGAAVASLKHSNILIQLDCH